MSESFELYTADCVGNMANCFYSNKVEITDSDSMREAIKKDHVCAEYKGNYRSVKNFVRSNVCVMDCDNDHSENEDDWITEDKLHDLMPEISYVIVYSRNHMKEKDGKAARPRFHVYFFISEITDAESYRNLKVAIYREYQFFDGQALDSARFIFGCDTDGVIWHQGFMYIDEVVEIGAAPKATSASDTEYMRVIPQGQRNSTLSRFAARTLKRYGECDKAYELFLQRAGDCEEPLSTEELNTIWNSAVKFFRDKVVGSDGYVPPDDYNNDFGGMSLKPEDFSDMGQAKVFSKEYKDEIRYTDATDYLRYNGNYWAEYRTAGIGALEEFVDLQLQDAKDALSDAMDRLRGAGINDDIIAKGTTKMMKECSTPQQFEALDKYMEALAYYKFVLKRRDYKYIVSAANTAKPMLEIKVTDLDKDGFLLNMPGMTINLKEGIGSGYVPRYEDFITKQTLCAPSDEGEDLWLDALNTFFCDDAELIDYVQKIVGMAAIGEVFNEALIIAYGDGRNGKSTFWNTISNVLGSYSGAISAETLTVGCRHNVRPEVAELKGKRLVIAAELEDGTRLNTAVVKKLCSTDEITAEKKYRDPFKFLPSHTIILYTNHLPRVGVSDAGTWRRLIVIPFNAKIEGNPDIKNYASYLTENAGGAVMKWIIEGAKKTIDEDFKIEQPTVVVDAIEAYRQDNDWLGEFLTECCDIDSSFMQTSGPLYQRYRDFCLSRGDFVRSTTDFYGALDSVGYERKRGKGGVTIKGLKLKVEDFLD